MKMQLYGLSAVVDYTTLSNSDLDALYATAFASGDSLTYTGAGVEILYRQETPLSAFEALFGRHRFPQYDAIQASGKTTAGFVATDVAQRAVVTSAGTIVNQAEGYLKKGAWIIGGFAALAFFWKFGKTNRK